MFEMKIKGRTVKVIEETGKFYFQFSYHPSLIQEIKWTFHGAKWDGSNKQWHCPINRHNQKQIDYYMGKKPFDWYKQPVKSVNGIRSLYDHQRELVNVILTYRSIIAGYEMGTGKSLAFIESAELSGYENIWYVGPKSGISAVRRELIKWDAKFTPTMMTYEGMTKTVKGVFTPPDYVFFDESSKLKGPTSKRSKASLKLVEEMRKLNKLAIVFMGTGTPAPKSPVDWWSQCRTACEGFIKEGNPKSFEQRLSVSKLMEVYNEQLDKTVKFNKTLFWLDDEKKCRVCGKMEDNHKYDDTFKRHSYSPSVNEVAKLYNRLSGLVHIKFKKDCLDLPDKIYQVLQVKPTKQMMLDVRSIKQGDAKPPQVASKMMQISDGFLYIDKVVGEQTCQMCNGNGVALEPEQNIMETCPRCEGSKVEELIERTATYSSTPKDEAMTELLEEHEEVGRLIVWGGFIATIDKLTKLALAEGWNVIQVDGRGYRGIAPDGSEIPSEDLLVAMDKSNPLYNKQFEKVCFVGNADAGGMALTLTASPTEVFYSNSHKGEARMQAEDRFHRAGMDVNVSPRIIDICCLPIDRMVLDRLKMKKDLQSLTMGELNSLDLPTT